MVEEIWQILKCLNQNCDWGWHTEFIEELKERIRKADLETYQEWQEDRFNVNHMFEVEDNGHHDYMTLLCIAAGYDYENVLDLIIEVADVNKPDTNGNTPLIAAAKNNNFDIILTLINLEGGSCDLKAVNIDRETAMHWCCIYDTQLAEMLVDRDADVNARDITGCTPLIWAANAGHINVIEGLVTKNGDANAKDDNNRNCVYFATINGHLEVVKYLTEDLKVEYSGKIVELLTEEPFNVLKYLIEEHNVDLCKVFTESPLNYAVANIDIFKYFIDKADLDAKDYQGNSILHTAASEGSVDVVTYLIEELNFDVGLRNNDDMTILHSAAYNTVDVVRYLIEQNVDLKAVDNKGLTIFHHAAKEGNVEATKFLIENANFDVNVKDNRGRTSLLHASKNNHLNTVKVLIENNADVTVGDDLKVTPLHKAAENGNLEVVKYLVDNNADLLAGDTDGVTPLHLAASGPYLDVVRYIIEEKGVDHDIKDKGEESPLMAAVCNDRMDTIKYLIEEKNADIDRAMITDLTILHFAANKGNIGLIKYLIDEKKADLNIANGKHCTPLHFAANAGHLGIVKYFIEEKGMDINAPDDGHWSVLHNAAAMGHLHVVKYLIEETGADFTRLDKKRKTPYDLAVVYKKEDVARYLASKQNITT